VAALEGQIRGYNVRRQIERLDVEVLHVFGVDAEGFEGGHVEGFLLDEGVADVGAGGGGEDAVVVGGAAAELGGGRWGGGGDGAGGGLEVLDVEHGDAGGVALEVGDGVGAADGDPAAVELEGDEAGVGEAEEFVEGDDAGLGGELHGVVVVAELDAGGFDLRSPGVETVGVPAVVVEGEGVDLVFVGEVLEARGIFDLGEGADEVLEAKGGANGEGFFEGPGEVGSGEVGADEGEVGGGHGLLYFGGGVAEEAGGFDFSVAEGGELLEGAEVIGG
jgi:hypothetical protein